MSVKRRYRSRQATRRNETITLERLFSSTGEIIYGDTASANSSDHSVRKLGATLCPKLEQITDNLMLTIEDELSTYGPCRMVFWATSLMGVCLMGTIIALENAGTQKH
jgi:hypothetical protein